MSRQQKTLKKSDMLVLAVVAQTVSLSRMKVMTKQPKDTELSPHCTNEEKQYIRNPRSKMPHILSDRFLTSFKKTKNTR